MSVILIAGGTGLVGQHLSRLLQSAGHEVIHLSRKPALEAPFPAYVWDVDKGVLDERAILRADVIINLAGAGIADRNWTPSRKKEIIDSRVRSAALLLKALQRTGKKPSAYLSAAAVGYYGDRGAAWMHETDSPGSGFLSESCIAWENAIDTVRQTGVRTVAFRIGIVLSTLGGALEKMLLPLKIMGNTYFGDGSQYYSWIHIDDLCRAFLFAIENPAIEGVYNAVSPHPLTNKELAYALAEAHGGGVLTLPAPAFALRLIFGEMADTILNSTRVSPDKILQAGFVFQFPDILPALKDLLTRKV